MEKEEFVRLVLQSEETLFHVSFSLLHNEADAADAVQEAVTKAFAGRNKLREKQYFKTWLIRILINECHTLLRKRKKTAPFEETDLEYAGAPSQGAYSPVKEEYLDLYRAIDGLEDKDKICVQLYYMEEYSVGQIAQVLKMPEGTVKSRLHRARILLRGMLKE